jgi:cytochrome c oxidase subunit 3
MAEAVIQQHPLPVGGVGRIGVGWWGLVCFIATEAALFGYLLFDYCYYAIQLEPGWMPERHPSLDFALPNTIIAILSSLAAWWGERGIRRGARGQLLAGFALAFLLGLAFLLLEGMDWATKPFTLSSSLYGSLYFTITGLHVAHLILGLVALLAILFWAALGYFDARRNTPVLIGAAYWHFVNLVWLVFFVALYLAPRLW